MKLVKGTLSVLSNLSAAASLGDAVGLVGHKRADGVFHISDGLSQPFPLANTIHAGLAILLAVCTMLLFPRVCPCDIHMYQAAKGVSASYDALVDLLESIEHFLRRLEIYTQIPHTPALDEMVVKIMVELLSTLAFVTKELKQGRLSESILVDVYLT